MVVGTHTIAAKEKVADLYANQAGPDNANSHRFRVTFFRIGEGGVETPGNDVRSPVEPPDSSLTDIRSPAKEVYFFEKAFDPSEITRGSGGLVQFTISLNIGEGTGPGEAPNPGGLPEFSEVGLFDESGVMVAYYTFPPVSRGTGTFSMVLNLQTSTI